MEAYCHPDNVNSWHLLERLGFKREAHLRRDIWFRKDETGADLAGYVHFVCGMSFYFGSIQTAENAEDVQGANMGVLEVVITAG